MARFEQLVPFISIAGNHDIGSTKLDYGAYLGRDFATSLPDQQLYGGGKGCYTTLSAGGCSFVFVGLGFDVCDEAALSWARSVFDAYPDYVGVFFTHAYLGVSDIGVYGRIYEKHIVKECPNVRLVLNGHFSGFFRQYAHFDDDGDGEAERTVCATLFNCQGRGAKDGYLRILSFDPIARSIFVETYSPFADDHVTDDWNWDAEEFTIENGF